ncbi:major facilitator superfamily domain-containing protein 6 isoform X2 [Cydia pomonella]|uniref:major facilitator superfamily domain-containing protein 6 isoform X2 n=1 Tax=Cydia pomonella TaxID=82600 RepID=UPI002ADD4788|nr:major facilitator superfamily domain-containing protein 6 isoform X2 [Cydia pomonella]
MKLKVDKSLVPIKAHFFFFFAALGPLLPQMNVFGRQLGVSPGAMGLVTSVLPLLWAAAKPVFGYVVDFWPNHRKLVFMLLIATMTGSYCCLWFLPMPDPPPQIIENIYTLNDTVYLKKVDKSTIDELILQKYSCQWTCYNKTFDVYLSNSTYVNTVYVDNDVGNDSCSLFNMEFNDEREGEVICVPKTGCNLICFDKDLNDTELNVTSNRTNLENSVSMDATDNLYMTSVFWAFVVLMCVGTVAFNVANCIGDAVCFDVLGTDRASKYGAQRAWGTAGYGLTALLGGALIDLTSGAYKDFTPAFIIALAATAVDLYSCRALNLPSLSSPDDSGKALRDVLRIPRVLVFIVFAVVAGTFDSFIIYYMFWFLEELAEETGSMAKIKLIEGVVVAGQSFIGELLFFYFSVNNARADIRALLLVYSRVCGMRSPRRLFGHGPGRCSWNGRWCRFRAGLAGGRAAVRVGGRARLLPSDGGGRCRRRLHTSHHVPLRHQTPRTKSRTIDPRRREDAGSGQRRHLPGDGRTAQREQITN